MRKLTLIVFGAALGFVAAHFVNQSPAGSRFFARVNRGTEELTKAFASGYRAAEREQLDSDLEHRLEQLDEQR